MPLYASFVDNRSASLCIPAPLYASFNQSTKIPVVYHAAYLDKCIQSCSCRTPVCSFVDNRPVSLCIPVFLSASFDQSMYAPLVLSCASLIQSIYTRLVLSVLFRRQSTTISVCLPFCMPLSSSSRSLRSSFTQSIRNLVLFFDYRTEPNYGGDFNSLIEVTLMSLLRI